MSNYSHPVLASMARKKTVEPRLEPRKLPRQIRSAVTREIILEAAAHILIEGGSGACTTNRIAERAGVSIGSLYQYWPNKFALLRELQQQEMRKTLDRIESILSRRYQDPHRQFRDAVRVFFTSESEESALRYALGRLDVKSDPATPESAVRVQATHAIARTLATRFGLSGRDATRWAEVVLVTVSSVAEAVTARESNPGIIRRWADTLSEMLLSQIGARAAVNRDSGIA